MNVFKKIMSTAVATATLLTATAFPVSATTYDQCDLNKDGYVGVADAAIFNKYLAGSYYVPNYNILDFNKSLTVDAADSEYIYAKLFGTSYSAGYWSRSDKTDTPDGSLIDFPAVSGFTPDAYASSTAGREYRRYSYKQKKELTPYTLTPTLGNLVSSVNSRAFIGNDDRYRAYGKENTGIVSLFKSGYGSATGFIVGDHQIATAAHCVYKNNNWVLRDSITIYNENGELTDKTLTPVEAHVPSAFIESNYPADIADTCYDYALITVEEDLSEYDCTYFSLGNSYNITKDNYGKVPIYLTGCPGGVYVEGNHILNTNCELYYDEGHVLYQNNTSILYFDMDSSDGNSGGPVYTIIKNSLGNDTYYTYTALAINSGGVENTCNVGSLITKYHLQFYNNNPNASYTVD